MKKLISLAAALILCVGGAVAQTNIYVNFAGATNLQACTVPQNWGFYFSVVTTNYPMSDSVHFHVDFGDGNFIDTTQEQGAFMVTSLDSGYFYHTYNADGIYMVTYIATMPDGNADTAYSSAMVTSICNNVTGRIYIDVNNDCMFNAGDVPYNNEMVRLMYNNSQMALSYLDPQGMYSLSAAPGYTYELRIDSLYIPNLHFTCSTYDGMIVTPAPNSAQDLIIHDTAYVHINFASDSSSFGNGNCAPSSGYFTESGVVQGYYAITDSINVYINFGDGQDTSILQPITNNGGLGSFWLYYLPHTYSAPGIYNVMYVATTPGGESDTVIHFNEVILQDTCGNVEGRLYVDNNNNCAYDSGDSVVAFVAVSLVNTSTNAFAYAITDSAGYYNLAVSPGNYNVSLAGWFTSNTTLQATCPASATSNVNVTSTNTVSSDFGFTCSSNYDLGGFIGLYGGFYPNVNAYIVPYIMNHSCGQTPASVQLILDPLVHYIGSCDTAMSPLISGDTLTWSFSNWYQYYSWYGNYSHHRCFNVIGDSTLQLGDTLCFTMIINPIAGDGNPADNIVTRCVPALVSLDPNVKDVSPRGTGPQGLVGQNTRFNYNVQFQNTGSGPAQNVFILDTLDVDLDISSLVITGSSHPINVTLYTGNILRLSFDNIWLADSTSDEPHSHGWLSYSITAKPWLPDGTTLVNTASIYFDFNPPAITNSTLNTINDPAGIHETISQNGISIFPVPTNDHLIVSSENSFSGNIILRDISGRIVATQAINGSQTDIFTGNLAGGLYMISVENVDQIITQKIVIRH